MASQFCDLCAGTDRLHRCPPGDLGNEEGTEVLLLCDDCYEERTGLLAACEPYCVLPFNHSGECREKEL